jgi:NADH-quinone oxidoreductase subunit J
MTAMAPSLFQWVMGLLAVFFAVVVVSSRNPVVSALSLMGTLFTTAALYFGLGAYFAGVVQILVYAGAIAVLFVFIVMLLDLKASRILIPGRMLKLGFAVLATGFFLVVTLWSLVPVTSLDFISSKAAEDINESAMSAKSIATNFLSTYMLPFQLTGFLILAAIAGVVLLSKPIRRAAGKEKL